MPKKPTVKEMVKKIEEKVGAIEIAVYTKDGQFVRVYSALEHGELFHRLAEEYCAKKGREGHYTKKVR